MRLLRHMVVPIKICSNKTVVSCYTVCVFLCLPNVPEITQCN